MKKFLFIVTLSLSGFAADVTSHTPSAEEAAAISTPIRSTVATQDKAAKLAQYIEACSVKRPGAEDEVRKLLNY